MALESLAQQVRHSVGRTALILSAGLLLALSATPAAAQWTTSGTNISNSNSGNVGVGTSNPSSRLTIVGPVQNGVYTVQIDSTAGGLAGSQHGILLIGTSATNYLTAGATTIKRQCTSPQHQRLRQYQLHFNARKYWWFRPSPETAKQWKR